MKLASIPFDSIHFSATARAQQEQVFVRVIQMVMATRRPFEMRGECAKWIISSDLLCARIKYSALNLKMLPKHKSDANDRERQRKKLKDGLVVAIEI